MDNQNDPIGFADAVRIFTFAMFAMLGGIVREMKSTQEMTLFRFIGGAFVGMFCGIVVFCFMQHYHADDWMTGGCTALSGYLGTPALDLISRMVKAALTR